MVVHGGKRTGAGRPKNAANKFSEAARAKAAAEGVTPLEYFLAVLRDPQLDRATRMDAGKAAAPYMHARLESIKHTGDEKQPVVHKMKSDAQFGTVVGILEGLVTAKQGSTDVTGELDQPGETGTTHPKR